jgi:hypothetical protein
MATQQSELQPLGKSVPKAERRKLAHLFSTDRMAEDQYLGSQEPPAKCYHVCQRGEPPFGFIWLALSRDEDAPDHYYVHVDYVYVLPERRGGMSTWLAGEVLRKFDSWVKRQRLEPDATVVSSSSPVTSAGNGFVHHLNLKLRAYCNERQLRMIGDGL